MKACGSCGAWVPDDAATCPNCGRATGSAPAPAPVPATTPAPSAPAPTTPPSEAGDALRRQGEERLKVLGGLYIACGVFALVMVAWSFINHASGAAQKSFDEIQRNPGPIDPEVLRMLTRFLFEPWYLALTHALPFAMGVLWTWSGVRLRSFEGRGPALASAFLMILPCAGCCCLNLPVGIYALVTLTRGDVVLALDRGARR